ncbi:MAG: serine hydrolase domain-containing protein [Arthrobacter sp.]
MMETHHVPGMSIAVTDAHGLLSAEGFGCADLSSGRVAVPETTYLWFSMSKIATATAALRLADKGRLDLDAPVGEFLPGFAARSAGQPRVRQLLNHTAGIGNPAPVRWVLPAGVSDTEAGARVRRILERYGRSKPNAGGRARYSNIGYLLLAEVISSAAGEPFEQHIHHHLLDPAGMTSSGYNYRSDLEQAVGYLRLPRAATPLLHAALPAGIVGERYGVHVALKPFNVSGAGYGGLIGPVTDVARLLRLHLADGVIDGRRILTAESAKAMRTITTPGRPFDLGLGWFRRPVDRNAQPAFVEHWGTGGGFWNAMRIYPDLGLGVAVMANTTRPYNHHTLMNALLPAFS